MSPARVPCGMQERGGGWCAGVAARWIKTLRMLLGTSLHFWPPAWKVASDEGDYSPQEWLRAFRWPRARGGITCKDFQWRRSCDGCVTLTEGSEGSGRLDVGFHLTTGPTVVRLRTALLVGNNIAS